MNIVDYVIIGVLGVSVLYGLYRGFVASVLSMGGGLISFLSAFALYPKLAALIQNNEELQRTLLHYTDASSRIGDLELALTNVINLGREGIAQVLANVQLPPPLDSILQVNLENLVYGAQAAQCSKWTQELRKMLREDSIQKLKEAGIEPPSKNL